MAKKAGGAGRKGGGPEPKDVVQSRRVGLALKAVRESARLTQASLAEAAGMKTTSIGRYEIGQRVPSVVGLLHLLRVMGRSLLDFHREYEALVAQADADVVEAGSSRSPK